MKLQFLLILSCFFFFADLFFLHLLHCPLFIRALISFLLFSNALKKKNYLPKCPSYRQTRTHTQASTAAPTVRQQKNQRRTIIEENKNQKKDLKFIVPLPFPSPPLSFSPRVEKTKRKRIFLQEIHMLASMWHRMEHDNFGLLLSLSKTTHHNDGEETKTKMKMKTATKTTMTTSAQRCSAHCRFIMSLVRDGSLTNCWQKDKI